VEWFSHLPTYLRLKEWQALSLTNFEIDLKNVYIKQRPKQIPDCPDAKIT